MVFHGGLGKDAMKMPTDDTFNLDPESPIENQRLFGEDWIYHGYEIDPAPEDEIDPCIIDGAPNNTCT